MEYKKTEVYKYLEAVNLYLKGDLNSFHKVCEEIEKLKEPFDLIPSNSAITFSLSPRILEYVTTSIETTSAVGKLFDYETTPAIPLKGRLTIPIATTLFAVADIVGYLLRNIGRAKDTKDNIAEFFKDKLIDENEIKVLVKVCRHGIDHSFFPKLGVGISYLKKNGTEKMFHLENEMLVLNVNAMEKIVIEKLMQIMSGKYGNFELMNKRFKKLLEEDEDFEKLVSSVKSKLKK